MKAAPATYMDTLGLSESGVWVRRLRNAPAPAEEAMALAQILQIWGLHELMAIDHYGGILAEVSGPELPPTWVYLIELVGDRLGEQFLYGNHPLSQVRPGEAVRLLALVQPPEFFVPGVLVETETRRRMVWLSPAVLP